MSSKGTVATKEPVARETTRPELPKFAPAVDIFDNGEEIVLIADMPGVPGNAVDVNLDRGNLTVRGRVNAPVPNGQLVLEEFRVGDYVRTFAVSEDIDPSGIEAELKDGVLLVRLPKAEERKPRKIQVRTG